MSQVTFDFSGCSFAVTGDSFGMGCALTKELAVAKAEVLAIARREEKLREMQVEF